MAWECSHTPDHLRHDLGLAFPCSYPHPAGPRVSIPCMPIPAGPRVSIPPICISFLLGPRVYTLHVYTCWTPCIHTSCLHLLPAGPCMSTPYVSISDGPCVYTSCSRLLPAGTHISTPPVRISLLLGPVCLYLMCLHLMCLHLLDLASTPPIHTAFLLDPACLHLLFVSPSCQALCVYTATALNVSTPHLPSSTC